MKTAALCDYLEELPTDEVADIYDETPARLLRAFNATPAQLRSLIEDKFPNAAPDEDDDDDEEDEGDDD